MFPSDHSNCTHNSLMQSNSKIIPNFLPALVHSHLLYLIFLKNLLSLKIYIHITNVNVRTKKNILKSWTIIMICVYTTQSSFALKSNKFVFNKRLARRQFMHVMVYVNNYHNKYWNYIFSKRHANRLIQVLPIFVIFMRFSYTRY